MCASIENTKSVVLEGVSSGEWGLKIFPTCNSAQAIISPMDNSSPSVAADQNSQQTHDTSFSLKSEKFKFDDLEVSYGKLEHGDSYDDASNPSCKKIISGTLCFGDCIFRENLNSDFKEVIASPVGSFSERGLRHVSVCGDDLSKALSRKQYSISIKQDVCKKFFWEIVLKSKLSFLRCSAIRGEIDCNELLD